MKSLSEDTMLWALVVSPEERAVWSAFRKSMILSPPLELLMLSPEPALLEEDFGACERMSFRTLVSEFSAFSIGLESLEERLRAPARVVLVVS